MEIAIRGEGEVVIRFIDQHGQTLLQERLVISGAHRGSRPCGTCRCRSARKAGLPS
jgi:hypothetical protein